MKFKKFLATVLAVAAVFSAFVVPASAASSKPRGTEHIGETHLSDIDRHGYIEYVIVGDANRDGVVNLFDSTHILHYLLKLETASWLEKNITGFFVDGIHYPPHWYAIEMDVDCDNDIDLIDSTRIKQYLLWRETN